MWEGVGRWLGASSWGRTILKVSWLKPTSNIETRLVTPGNFAFGAMVRYLRPKVFLCRVFSREPVAREVGKAFE